MPQNGGTVMMGCDYYSRFMKENKPNWETTAICSRSAKKQMLIGSEKRKFIHNPTM